MACACSAWLPRAAHEGDISDATTERRYCSTGTSFTVWFEPSAAFTALMMPRYDRTVPDGSHTPARSAYAPLTEVSVSGRTTTDALPVATTTHPAVSMSVAVGQTASSRAHTV